MIVLSKATSPVLSITAPSTGPRSERSPTAVVAAPVTAQLLATGRVAPDYFATLRTYAPAFPLFLRGGRMIVRVHVQRFESIRPSSRACALHRR
ncbi:hypothetical protein GCM10009609_28710 [Pseudonocardia aurantiaca]